ncbi:MAG TPA: hypothetical protein VF522_19055 [Ramlibacter sp.]|uniref:hypothetical protein n=1 Tax=Ramlibacter sp. TaxID=1917967 RepID=UPI002ED21D3A
MPDSSKLQRLVEIREAMGNGSIRPEQAKRQFINDIDGRLVGLSAPDAVAVLDRRIAAEQAKAAG